MDKHRTRSGRVVAGLVGLALACALVVGAAGPAGAVGLSVSPSGGLTSGQSITVSGSGFEPGIQLYVTICDPSKGAGVACDYGNFRVAGVDGGGSFSITMAAVAQFGSTDCFAISCAVQTSKVGDGADRSQEGTAPVSFAAPPPPPPPPPDPPPPPPAAGSGGGATTGGATGGSTGGVSGAAAVDPGTGSAGGEAVAAPTATDADGTPSTTVKPTTSTTVGARDTDDDERAVALIRTDGSGGGSGASVGLLAGIVVIVLAAGAATYFFLRHRRAMPDVGP